MMQYTMYVCKYCGFESKDRDEVERHEAGHLGLTVEEYHEYTSLVSLVSYIEHSENEFKNIAKKDATEVYNRALGDLKAFKEKHNINC